MDGKLRTGGQGSKRGKFFNRGKAQIGGEEVMGRKDLEAKPNSGPEHSLVTAILCFACSFLLYSLRCVNLVFSKQIKTFYSNTVK